MAKAGDHRVRVTKMLIRRAFTDMIGKMSIERISVKELCQRAGINRGTFYAHYTDIYDLRDKLEQEMMTDFQRALEPLQQAEAGMDMQLEISTAIFRCVKDNADICAVILGPYGDTDFAARVLDLGWEKCLNVHAAHFPAIPASKLEYFYAFISAGCIGLLRKWLDGGMRTSVEELARASQGLMMRGFGSLLEEEGGTA